jgi:hypothetical protein
MNPVFACSTIEHLRWFLSRSPTSVVLASSIAFESIFPVEVRNAFGGREPCPDFAVARQGDVSQIAGRSVQYDELLVFANSKLVGFYPDRAKTFAEALEEFADHQKYVDGKARRVRVVAGLVRDVQRARRQPEEGSPAHRSDPHEVLGVKRGASLKELQEAKTRLLFQYHPDLHVKSGAKIREVAEVYTRAINAAFDDLAKLASVH